MNAKDRNEYAQSVIDSMSKFTATAVKAIKIAPDEDHIAVFAVVYSLDGVRCLVMPAGSIAASEDQYYDQLAAMAGAFMGQVGAPRSLEELRALSADNDKSEAHMERTKDALNMGLAVADTEFKKDVVERFGAEQRASDATLGEKVVSVLSSILMGDSLLTRCTRDLVYRGTRTYKAILDLGTKAGIVNSSVSVVLENSDEGYLDATAIIPKNLSIDDVRTVADLLGQAAALAHVKALPISAITKEYCEQAHKEGTQAFQESLEKNLGRLRNSREKIADLDAFRKSRPPIDKNTLN